MDINLIGNLDKSASRWNNSVKVAFVSVHQSYNELEAPYIASLQGTNWQVKKFETHEEAMNWCLE